MFDPARKWAYIRNGRIDSILTTVPLLFGWGRAIGIAGVATRLCYRGEGLASTLLREVLKQAKADDEGPALLFAKKRELYESVGFRVLDDVIRAPILSSEGDTLPGVLAMDEVETLYEGWSRRNPDRLRRDERRWNYWKWNLRVCCPFSTGYLCVEGGLVRECIVDEQIDCWPVAPGTEWIGLNTMARQFGVPIGQASFELHLMGRGFERVPQIFMTDQF
jgi:hypothetical protein